MMLVNSCQVDFMLCSHKLDEEGMDAEETIDLEMASQLNSLLTNLEASANKTKTKLLTLHQVLLQQPAKKPQVDGWFGCELELCHYFLSASGVDLSIIAGDCGYECPRGSSRRCGRTCS